MIERILNILKEDTRLYGWNVREIETNSYQLFFIKQELDMNREVLTTEFEVTIFVKQGNQLGKSKFVIPNEATDTEIKAKLDEQISYCSFTLAKMYNLPKKYNLKPTEKPLNMFDNHSLKEAAFIVADALFEADKYVNTYINSSEIFINCEANRYYDSNGNEFVYVRNYGEVELVITGRYIETDSEREERLRKGIAFSNYEEVEIYKFFTFASLDSDYIRKMANQQLLDATDRAKAIKMPKTNINKILLTGDAVVEFFKYFCNKANVSNIYSNASKVTVGTNLLANAPRADKIDIRMEVSLKNSTKCIPFDEDGVTLKKSHIIDNGVVRNLWGPSDKAQYLNKPVNGIYKNIVVQGGSLTDENLEDENYIEVKKFSIFSIDSITGTFGSEIRLGYIHERGKDPIVISGGSVSGSVKASLSNLRFSKELEQQDNFLGPKYVLLDNVTFSKGE